MAGIFPKQKRQTKTLLRQWSFLIPTLSLSKQSFAKLNPYFELSSDFSPYFLL